MKQNKYKVLLVEDEDNIRNLVSTMLDTAGYQTILAQSCTSAQMMYTSYLPDLIILDLGLPDMDGMHLLRFVRQNYLTIHAKAEYTVKMTLSELESRLDDRFFRAGRSFIINLAEVRSVTRQEVRLSDGTAIPLPRGQYEPLNRAIITRG